MGDQEEWVLTVAARRAMEK